MKKRILFGLALLILLTGFTGERNDIYPPVKNESFTRGEVLKFKMTYGIFTVGRGSANIHEEYFKLNNRDCYKVDIFAETVGLVNWVEDVKDQFGAYVDTAALVPHMFYRRIREGRYRKDEQTYFDHENKKIRVREADRKTGKFKDPLMYDAPAQVRDMIAGFLYMRTMNFSKLQVNDTVVISGFFEDEFYKLRIIYKGKDVTKTKVGKVRTLKFKPVMPKNKLFDGENSITVFFSDDKNRIPVKIDAEMFIGSAGVELTDYSGLRNPLNLAK
ncbi:DUF3108 domain-containing protein [Fulvivirgaceae bacterium PWU4]|uniref:DUF3108 domain-containing protein n=1 Tax=Chryseosolibacter histidini TaxID=2782349 RepID=A0AAP2DIQ9_9BACT|nr:DUF3108 domain-containing protein [Chryseosolibacter histidini]MBT1696930.1 DUF3108 domain-containing protein [Chryseosolibacter histidini]